MVVLNIIDVTCLFTVLGEYSNRLKFLKPELDGLMALIFVT